MCTTVKSGHVVFNEKKKRTQLIKEKIRKAIFYGITPFVSL